MPALRGAGCRLFPLATRLLRWVAALLLPRGLPGLAALSLLALLGLLLPLVLLLLLLAALLLPSLLLLPGLLLLWR